MLLLLDTLARTFEPTALSKRGLDRLSAADCSTGPAKPISEHSRFCLGQPHACNNMSYPNPYLYGYPGSYAPSPGAPPPYSSGSTAYPVAAAYGLVSGAAGMAYPSSTPKSYYLIKSKLGELVLDIEGGSYNPGVRVITYPMKKWNEWHTQLWYDDYLTGTIRSKATGFCLDLAGDTLVVNPYQPGNPNQLWERFGTVVRNRQVLHRVLDVSGANKSAGGKVIVWDQNGQSNQQFDSLSVPGLSEPYARRNFFIVSEMNSKVLDISGGNPCAGAGVITWPKKSPVANNQLWHFDSEGVIHSAVNDMVLETQSGLQARMMPNVHQPYHHWTVIGNRIVSKTGECLDIQGARNTDGAPVISFGYKGASNQHWRLEFV